MREILFRGKANGGGWWVCGHYAVLNDGYRPDWKRHYILSGELRYNDQYGKEDIRKVEIDPNTLCQYTSLKDRNGRRIFEGDIVAGTKYGKPCTGVIAYGKWNCGCCWGVYGFAAVHGPEIRDSERNLEVIGNIYDNPELVPEMEEDDE